MTKEEIAAPPDNCCGSCAYMGVQAGYSVCKRYPPSANSTVFVQVGHANVGVGKFPIVAFNEHCGEWASGQPRVSPPPFTS